MGVKIKSEFNRNFLKLFKGTIIGQVIPIAVSPIISRLYTPDEIGTFALYSSVIAVSINIVCLKFDQAIVLPAKLYEAKRIFSIGLKVSLWISILTFLVLALLKVFVLLRVMTDFSNWWFLLCVHLYFLGIFQANTYFLNRIKAYDVISNSRIFNGVLYSFLQVTLFKFQELGLVLSLFTSRIVTSIYLFWNTGKKDGNMKRSLLDKKYRFTLFDKALMKKHKDFPIYSTSNSLLNSASNQLPVFLLQYFYSAQVTGLYSWANRIIQIPMGFIISSVQQVFYQEVARKISEGSEIYGLVKKTYKKLLFVGIVPYTLAFLFAPQIFSWFFGSQWTQAGEYTRYLIPWLFVVFLNSPITGIVPALGKQKAYFINELILFFLRAIALALGYFIWNNERLSIAFFGLIGFLYNIYLFFYLLKFAKNESL